MGASHPPVESGEPAFSGGAAGITAWTIGRFPNYSDDYDHSKQRPGKLRRQMPSQLADTKDDYQPALSQVAPGASPGWNQRVRADLGINHVEVIDTQPQAARRTVVPLHEDLNSVHVQDCASQS